jgi:hypothetical protein
MQRKRQHTGGHESLSKKKKKEAKKEEDKESVLEPDHKHVASSLPVKQVSTFEVQPVPLKNDANKLAPNMILGYEAIPMLSCNIFALARKNTGKTTLEYSLLEACADKHTKIYLFAATHNTDPTFLAMKDMLKQKGCRTECFYDTKGLSVLVQKLMLEAAEVASAGEALNVDADPRVRANALLTACLLKQQTANRNVVKSVPYESQFPEKDQTHGMRPCPNPSKKHAIPKSPRYIFVFDDVSEELRKPWITELMKIQRHLVSKLIIGTQYYHDLPIGGAMQVDFLMLFKGLGPEKLQMVYDRSDQAVSFTDFVRMYRDATAEPHSFLTYQRGSSSYRRNLSHEYVLGDFVSD